AHLKCAAKQGTRSVFSHTHLDHPRRGTVMPNVIILAQESATSLTDHPQFWLAAILVTLAVMAFLFVTLLARQYKRCPSNRVLVIYGRTTKGKAATTIHGGAAFIIPLIQDYDYLSLEPIQI